MKQNIFLAFRERSFLFLWVGEVFTQISSNLFTFYLVLSVFTLTKSNTAVAGIILTFTIPAILFGILAGVYVDHWSKKHVLIWTNLLRALLMFLLAFLHTNLFVIYSFSLIISFLTQFFIPAENPLIPLVVPKSALYSANALFGLALFGSVMIAYMLSGTVILTFGEQGSLILLSIMLFFGGVSIFFVKYKSRDVVDIRSKFVLNIKQEIISAFRLITKTKQIYSSLFLLALTQILILLLAAITPGYASQVLHIQIEKFPIVFVTPAAIGMFIGAIILVNKFQHVAKEKMVIFGLFLSGVSLLILPYGSLISSKEFVRDLNMYIPHILNITVLHIIVVIAFLLGLANSLVFVPSNTLLLENTNDDNRGKIYGSLNAIIGIFSFIPLIIVGSLSDLIGVSRVITGMGISILGICFYQYILHKRTMRG